MAKETDQSMEEILQSIKRIIAEEGEPAPSGSDVLELTEMLSEEDMNALMMSEHKEESSVATLSIEEIMAAPIAPEAPAAVTPVAEPVPVAMPEVAPPPPPPAAAVSPAVAVSDDAPLVSDTTLASSAAAFAALKNIPHPPLPPMPASGLQFRSGSTIEDLVLEALRPMLKDWLDENLTKMVERLVEKEVRRLSAHG